MKTNLIGLKGFFPWLVHATKRLARKANQGKKLASPRCPGNERPLVQIWRRVVRTCSAREPAECA